MAKKLRVIIITQYFHPENFRITNLATELVKDGHHVDALVGIPNYPKGKYFDGYGLFKKRFENYEGVKIYRCFQFPRGNKSMIMLGLNYLSFVISASLWVIFKFAFKKKYDAIIAYEPSPITLILPAILLGKLRRTPVLSWIQDIWPDSITDSTTERQNKVLIPLLNPITEFVYKHSDKLLVSSPGMEELICRKNDYSNKIEWVPNWSEDFFKGNIQELPQMPKGFNIVMAGTINDGIGINEVIKFTEKLSSYKDINIVFIGGGSKKDYLNDYVKSHGLQNVYVLGMYPYEMMPSFYAKADAMFLSLAKTNQKHLDVTIPARLQSYMSAGKPVFAMIGSGATNVIKDAHCGFVAKAGDFETLASMVIENYKNKDLLQDLGKNSRKAYEKYFTIQVGTRHFEDLILKQSTE